MTRPGGTTRWLGILLLAACLLGTQFNLAEHGVGHAFHEHDEPCIECLALPGFAAVPAQPPRLRVPSAPHEYANSAVPPTPTFGRRLSFRSRAPPQIQNR